MADLTNLYEYVFVSAIKMIKLKQETLFPDRFKRQKIPLVINVFNKKTAVALKCFSNTKDAIFSNQLIPLWSVLNVKL